MTIWWLIIVAILVVGGGAGFGIIMSRLSRLTGGKRNKGLDPKDAFDQKADEEVSHLFNKEFREELRNRGRLKFEKIIEENAMFLKQDLQLTTAQLNDHMKKQAAEKIDAQLAAYAKTMQDLQEIAKNSLQQATSEVEKQRAEMMASLQAEISKRKEDIMREYESNMAEVIEHYLLKSIGEELDFKTQIPFIVAEMEKNKDAIIEDMKL